jgi:predicted Zn-dependent protease
MAPLVQPGTFGQALANGRRLLDRDASSALLQAQTLLKGQPGSAPALRLMGAAFRRLGRKKEAERAELDAIRASRFDPVIGKAVRLFQQGQTEQAEALLAPFAEPSEDDDPVALLLLGEIWGRRSAFRQSEACFARSLAAAPSYGEAKVALAR